MLLSPPIATSAAEGAAAIVGVITAIVAVVTALLTLIPNVRSIRMGGFSVELAEVQKELDALATEAPLEAEGALPGASLGQGLTPHRLREVDRRSFALFEQYHTQGLAQSRQSFRFSLVFASLGFLIIAAAVVDAVIQNRGVGGANAVSLLGGTVIEAVSALFFVQSNRARLLMEKFFDRLREDRALDEALRLSDEITDPLVQSRLKTALAFTLADSDASDLVVRTVMGSIFDPDATSSPDGAAK